MDNAAQIAAVLAGILRGKNIPAFTEFARRDRDIPQTRTFVTICVQSENTGEEYLDTNGARTVPVQLTLRLRLHANGEHAAERINALWFDDILPAVGSMNLKVTGIKTDAAAFDDRLGCLVREVRITVDAVYVFTEEEFV